MAFKSLGLVLLFLATGCSWVNPSLKGLQVNLLDLAEVADCQKLSITSSKTLTKVFFIPRPERKIVVELVTLAKNEAAILGGDTIAAEGGAVKGEQDFGVYRCRPRLQ